MPTEPKELRQSLTRAMSEDPGHLLTGVRQLREWLDEREETGVLAARAEDWPWSHIAALLGRSKQAVWEKYSEAPE